MHLRSLPNLKLLALFAWLTGLLVTYLSFACCLFGGWFFTVSIFIDLGVSFCIPALLWNSTCIVATVLELMPFWFSYSLCVSTPSLSCSGCLTCTLLWLFAIPTRKVITGSLLCLPPSIRFWPCTISEFWLDKIYHQRWYGIEARHVQ